MGTQDEQISALPVTMERYPPEGVLWTRPTAGSTSSRTFYRQLSESHLDIVEPEAGQALDLGDGVRLELLAVTSRGAVLLLEWGDRADYRWRTDMGGGEE